MEICAQEIEKRQSGWKATEYEEEDPVVVETEVEGGFDVIEVFVMN